MSVRTRIPVAIVSEDFFRQSVLAECPFTGHGYGLFEAERYGIGGEVRRFVQRHAESVGRRGFFQCHGKRKQGLVTLYRHAVGMCMKQVDFFFPLRKFAVRQGKQRPYFTLRPLLPAKAA